MLKRFPLVLVGLVFGGSAGLYLGHSSLLRGQPARPVSPPAVPKELTSYRDIVKRVLPAVVSIEAQGKARGARPRDPEDEPPPGDVPFGPAPRGADEPTRIGFGSGFLVSDKGVIVTNNHVVDGADHLVIELRDGRKFTTKDFKTDPKTDLAVVRIKSKLPLPYLEFGDSSAMEIGDRVLAVGAPFGLAGTVTQGIISAKGRALRMNMYEDFLQTDAAINPGNSGGPLVNLEGRVIGINSVIKSRSGGFQGVGLAISSNLAKNIMTALLRDGVVRRGYLGVQIRPIKDEEEATKLGLKDTHGVVVTTVFPDAPSSKAGLKRGDVIVKLGGKPIEDDRALQTRVAALPLGKPVEVEVVRDGRPKTLRITIEEQPKDYGTTRRSSPDRPPDLVTIRKLGMQLTDLTDDLADELRFKEDARGALIWSLRRSGLAASSGLKPGLLITAVNGKPVTSAKAAADAIKAGSLEKGIRLRLMTNTGASRTVLIQSEDK
jgi:serine protease Do